MKRASLLFFLLAGCATVQTQLPDIPVSTLSSERLTQETLALKNIDKLTERLMRVSAPILKANTDLCPKTKLDIGVTTHSLSSYSKRIRIAAARELGAREDISIFNVRSGSSADKAGLKRGDILLSTMQKPLSATSKRFQALLKG